MRIRRRLDRLPEHLDLLPRPRVLREHAFELGSDVDRGVRPGSTVLGPLVPSSDGSLCFAMIAALRLSFSLSAGAGSGCAMNGVTDVLPVCVRVKALDDAVGHGCLPLVVAVDSEVSRAAGGGTNRDMVASAEDARCPAATLRRRRQTQKHARSAMNTTAAAIEPAMSAGRCGERLAFAVGVPEPWLRGSVAEMRGSKVADRRAPRPESVVFVSVWASETVKLPLPLGDWETGTPAECDGAPLGVLSGGGSTLPSSRV